MKKLKLLLVLLFLSGNIMAQIKVKSTGQVEIDGGNGISGQTAPRFHIHSTNSTPLNSTALSLVNTSRASSAAITLDFKSPDGNGNELSYVSLQTIISDKTTPKAGFNISTYSNGYFRRRLGIYYRVDNDYDANIHFNTGRAGATPEDRGIWISNIGDGEATIHPNGNGWGYIGTSSAHWRKLYVWYAYYNSHATITSDRRMKNEIQQLDNGILSKINKVNGVQYKIKNDILKSSELSFKEKIDIGNADNLQNFDEAEKNMMLKREKALQREAEKKHFGFIAQELIEIFPEVVEYNEEEDSYGIQYTALIPVLFEGMKEQQSIIEKQIAQTERQQDVINAQSLKIKELEEKLVSVNEIDGTTKKMTKFSTVRDGNNATTNAFLYQNIPNPFSSQTEIKYYIPEEANNAVLFIFNLQGTLLKTERITTTGHGSIVINGSLLPSGVYIYSLVLDGQEVDLKRMILTD